ncbi:MAG: hypothetical protein E7660_04125 [Ruminococcaceae bacterium]|nr:hypothetical protein [Oscillospiraceae bacterium]
MKHIETYKINVHDTDMNGYLSPTGHLRYMQDCSNCHMEAVGPSYDELLEKHLSFILSRQKLQVYEPVFSHDEVTVSTWATVSHGVTFERCYRVEKEGRTVAEVNSVWALLNTETGRLCKAAESGISYGSDEAIKMEMPRRLAVPENLEKLGERYVSYADADKNMHMNNTKYADLVWGFVPEFVKKRVKTLDIIYVSEAPLGEKLEVFGGMSGDGYYVKTVREDGKVNVQAYIEWYEL